MILSLVPSGTIRGSVLNTIKYDLPQYLPYEKIQREQKHQLPDSYDPVRKQYTADSFFESAESLDYESSVIITDVDLRVGSLDYVFGHYKGSTALVSLRRLDPSFTEGNDPQTFRNRLLNEVAHQLGHTFGLVHCERKCIMQRISTERDLDKRPFTFCRPCLKTVEKHFKA